MYFNTIFIKERTHEISIYRSLGLNIRSIIFQIITELTTISIFSLSCSLILGRLVSRKISEILLINALSLPTFEQMHDSWESWRSAVTKFDEIGLNTSTVNVEEMIELLNLTLDYNIIKLYILSFLLVMLIATYISVKQITKLNIKNGLL